MVPLVGETKPMSILIVVVLPAPFGPRKPKISPRFTSSETPRTASTRRRVNGLWKVFASDVIGGRRPPTRRRRRSWGSRLLLASGGAVLVELVLDLRGLTPSTVAAFDVEPPHASSVLRMA